MSKGLHQLQQISGLSEALTVGISPKDLHGMQVTAREILPAQNTLSPIKIAGVAVLGLIGAGILATAVPSTIPIPEWVRVGLDFAFTPGNATVPEATLQAAVHAALQWIIYAVESVGMISYAGGKITEQIGRIEDQNKLRELFTAVESARTSGELKLHMGPHIAVNLGGGDAIGTSILTELGVGTRGLPYSEVGSDVSGFDDIWARFKLPKTPEEKIKFFEYLDSVGFEKAVGVVLCPVKTDEAFAPNTTDQNAFDLSMSDIFERIDLMDEYVLGYHKGEIPLKGTLIIGDEHIQVHLGKYRGKNTPAEEMNSYTLRDEVNRRNNLLGRKDNPSSHIDVLDTTDTVLQLAHSPVWNPDGLPLAYISDSSPRAEAYGSRVEDRCGVLDIPFTTDSSTISLNLVHGATDTEIKHAARHLEPGTILPIVISSMFDPQSPYKPLFLTDVITREAISRMKKMQWIE